MARDNQTNTLELHIKVNGQNLSAISEKCNIGTLRIPSDPSWPKIPSRHSSNNTDDIIEPPCVITLTGTPRKGRSVVRTVASRPLKSRLNQGCETITHIPKRLPGCFDPRFRRQISRQKAEKPDEFYITKNDEQTPELNTSVTQGTEKLENKSRETSEGVNNYVPACHNVNNLLSNVTKSTNKMTDYPIDEQSILEARHCPTLQYATDERYNVGNRFPQEQKQETNRPLFLMVNEKRIHALPINAVNTETASLPAQSLQCYSVQIPVVAYRDIPLQISSVPTQMEKDVKMPSVCQNDSVKGREIVGNICTKSMKSTSSMYSFRESKNEKYPLDDIECCNANSNDDISKNKSISKNCEGHHTFERKIGAKENVASLNQDITLDNDRCGNFNELKLDNAVGVNNDKSKLSYSNLNIAARLKNFVGQSYVIDSCIANGEKNEREMLKSNERKMTKTRIHSCVDTGIQKLTYHVKDDRDNADKSWTNVINDKVLDKSSVFSQVDDKEYSKNNKKRDSKKEKHGEGELRINVKRKAAPMNLSRKAKSFLRKKSRFAITDSDCTLILPGYRGIKGKRYKKSRGRSKISQSLHGRNGINSANSILVKYNASKQDRINSRSLMNLQTRNSFEKPSSIPLETQELLNKSYWEYYWKLRRKIKPDNAKERDECLNKHHLPESQTLRQCSVLSCMINTALRDSTQATGAERASSNPNMTSVVRESVSALPSMLVKKIQRKRMKRASKRLLGLRAIALLCIAMYVAVIFLPMMYDYFFDEEYDDENMNYIELMFQYIASSFGEALDRVIDVLTTILLRPVRFDRKR